MRSVSVLCTPRFPEYVHTMQALLGLNTLECGVHLLSLSLSLFLYPHPSSEQASSWSAQYPLLKPSLISFSLMHFLPPSFHLYFTSCFILFSNVLPHALAQGCSTSVLIQFGFTTKECLEVFCFFFALIYNNINMLQM